jgi:hypothetical protein
MINSIALYLDQLRREMAGCDRATIQDALSDAEEYLSNALASAKLTQPGIENDSLFTTIVNEYGSPAEIAEAYHMIEKHYPAALPARADHSTRSVWVRFFGIILDPRAWGSILYFVIALATGIFYFTWAVTGLSLSLGLLVLVIGIPLTGLFILSTRGLAILEGRLVESLLGLRMPHRAIFSPRSRSLWAKFKELVLDRYSWQTLAYFILMLPLGIIYFTLFVTLLSVSIALVAVPILEYGFGMPIFTNGGDLYYLAAWVVPLVVIAGALLFILTLHLSKRLGNIHGRLAKSMLVRD